MESTQIGPMLGNLKFSRLKNNEVFIVCIIHRRIGDIMNDVVDKHAVTWIASAGNHGPALCTIGAPPDISKTTIIGNNSINLFYLKLIMFCLL